MRHVARQVLLTVLLLAPAAAVAQAAATCTVAPPLLTFGAYDPISGADLRTQGTFAVSCSHGNPQIRLSIGPGQSGSIAQRELRRAGGTTALLYNLYRDAALSALWGEGAAGLSFRAKDRPPVVYGRIPALQTGIDAGSYTDTLVVTIEY
jgi:spore coat protein U-like protein